MVCILFALYAKDRLGIDSAKVWGNHRTVVIERNHPRSWEHDNMWLCSHAVDGTLKYYGSCVTR